MRDCLFCTIVNKEIPCYSVYEDDQCLAFLDISQATLGHTLVVCKEHYPSLLEIPAPLLAHLMKVAQKIAQAQMQRKGVKGINILNNCQKVAGQAIMHFHLHVIPRFTSDDLKFDFQKHSLSPEEFLELASEIKKSLV